MAELLPVVPGLGGAGVSLLSCGGHGLYSGDTVSPGRPSGSQQGREQPLAEEAETGDEQGRLGSPPTTNLSNSTLAVFSPAEWMSLQLSASMAKFPRARAVRFWMLSVFTH